MSTWAVLAEEFNEIAPEIRGQWLLNKQRESVAAIGANRRNRNVVLYGSCFLQKPHVQANNLSITNEDVNGLMSVIHGMQWDKELTLVLHTPGGVTNATESIVAYLRSKFKYIEVIIPTFAMSAGTMISLASDLIILGRQSQLGPIDPQMNIGGKTVSARAVVEQFKTAKEDILGNAEKGIVGDLQMAHLWVPILQSLGPSLLQEAQNALDYSEQMVAKWATKYMFKGRPDAEALGKAVAFHFNDATTHKSHGRRIDRDEARAQGVVVENLEDDQELQEAVLTAYHLMTIAFENGPLSKVMISDTGQVWAKNFITPEEQQLMAAARNANASGPATRPSLPTAPNRAERRGNKR